MPRRKRPADSASTSSTADIAFLLLVFFLMTTTIISEQGLAIQLPPKTDSDPLPQHERNLFTVVINSQDNLLVEGAPNNNLDKLSEKITQFVLNDGRDSHLSDSPQKAVVSLKTDRGTTYHRYIDVYDAVKAAYYQLYSERLGITVAQVRDPSAMPSSLRICYEQLRKEVPMQISLAEPSSVKD